MTILNDVSRKLYDYHNKNEKNTLREMKARHSIECSGKGSNEREDYNKEIVCHNKKFQLTCNPYTKLYKKRQTNVFIFAGGVMR